MTLVLKANSAQKSALDGFTNGFSKIEFIQDGNGDWVVGVGVLQNPDFAELTNQFEQLEEVQYTPILMEEEPVEAIPKNVTAP